MTSLFPHAAYEEDQPHAHSILYLHTIRSGAMMGSFLSLITAPVSLLVSRYRHGTAFTLKTFLPRLLTHSGRGLVIGALFGALATAGRMWGREEIEWQDRAWRLQENKPQAGTDFWSLDNAALGAVAAVLVVRRGIIPGGMGLGSVALGGAGLGMATGLGYMIYASPKQSIEKVG
ncbi:hypothetical protein BU26DRAFT_36317 [Trematosphaeria pertusa]|uniref:Uncharacterized protein n=1 Tax=Trematosphaeria pertusa TaxID=390896 RepID=A0A6A6J2P6_9PLEO|nr:uncharacterized protein BU26DRAFT_36317 [Trematosphaeria pertusa]KAF2257114.1 hypothetical protein BU26DRAFT_36317 [Trematosphaeria pertusa]